LNIANPMGWVPATIVSCAMQGPASASAQTAQAATNTCCPVVELRQYTLHPGKRDVLITLFDDKFVAGQEDVGMNIIGQFRDAQNPDRFVWLRGFAGMDERAQALKAFYSGPVWQANRDVANPTMIDSDNVLLLRPARPTSGFKPRPGERAGQGATAIPRGLIVATLWYFDAPVNEDFISFFEGELAPQLEAQGAAIEAYLVTEASANTFPRLPVREGENVFAWFALFADREAYEQQAAALAQSAPWKSAVAKGLAPRIKGQPEVLLLTPTARSQLHL
jgi:hypothetical protein